MDEKKSWVGVFFPADEGTLVVPSSWLVKKDDEVLCWYPPASYLPRDIAKAVDKREEPNPELGWTLLPSRVECDSNTRLRCEKKLKALDKGRVIADTTDSDVAKKRKANMSLTHVGGSSSSTTNSSRKKTSKPIHKVILHGSTAPEPKRRKSDPQPSISILNRNKDTGSNNEKSKSSTIGNRYLISNAPSASEFMKTKALAKKRQYGQQPFEHLFSDEEDLEVTDRSTVKIPDQAEQSSDSSSDEGSVSIVASNEESKSDGSEENESFRSENDLSVEITEEEENEPPPQKEVSHSEEKEPRRPTDSKSCCPCSVGCCPCSREERAVNRRFRKRVSGLLSSIELYMYRKTPAMVSKPPTIAHVEFPMTTVEQVAALCSVLSSNNQSIKEKLVHHFSWYNDKLDVARTIKAVTDALMTDDLVEKFNLCGKGMKNKVGLKKTFPEIPALLSSIMRVDTPFTEKQLEQKLMVYFARVQERKKKKAKAAEEMAGEANPSNE